MGARLTETEGRRIEAAVREAEDRTAAEFRVGLVPQSASYGEWRALGAALLTFAVSAGTYLFLPKVSVSHILLFQPALALVCWLFCGIPGVLLALAPDAREEAQVLERAKAMFFDASMQKTSARTGVLIFLSLLERRVQILVDVAVAQVLPDAELRPFAASIAQAARRGSAAEGICQALDQLSKRLSQDLPRTPGRKNELPDTVQVER